MPTQNENVASPFVPVEVEDRGPFVAVLCGCGWGDLRMPEAEVPEECPVCGSPLGEH